MTASDEAAALPTMRPHCQSTAHCKAAKPTTHCRSCAAKALFQRPGVRESHRAGLAKFFADPERSAKHREAALANIAEYRDRPGVLERLRARMPAVQAKSLTKPARAKLLASAAERGRKRTATVLAWCPEKYRDDYRFMTRTKALTAKEARAIVEQWIESDSDEAKAKRAIADFNMRQHRRVERERAQAY